MQIRPSEHQVPTQDRFIPRRVIRANPAFKENSGSSDGGLFNLIDGHSEKPEASNMLSIRSSEQSKPDNYTQLLAGTLLSHVHQTEGNLRVLQFSQPVQRRRSSHNNEKLAKILTSRPKRSMS